MTDGTMNEEDLLILRILENPSADAAGNLDESGETLRRLYTETVGILAYELEPAEPPAVLRARLLTRAGEQAEFQTRAGGPSRPGTSTGVQNVLQTRAIPTYRPAVDQEAAPRVRRVRWPAALAAILALGFMGLSGWLFYQVQEERAELARLNYQIKSAREQGGDAGRLRSELAALRESFEIVSAPGIVCALRPVSPQGVPPPQPGAHGLLFVAADHQHWYLSLHGLQPAASGSQYQLWWLVGSAAISGGTFDVTAGEPVRLSSPAMPTGTSGAAITIEPQGGARAPGGPQVLRGEQIVQVL